MRHVSRSLMFAACLGVITLFSSGGAHAIKVSPPPSLTDLCQTWFGFSTNDWYTIAFTLEVDRTGTGVLISGNQREPFTVTSWDLEQYHLSMSVHLQSADRHITEIDGVFKQHLLSFNSAMLPHPERLTQGGLPGPLELSFSEGGTQVRFSAWPERDLDEMLKQLKGSKSTRARGGA